jgi:hypothetical protein
MKWLITIMTVIVLLFAVTAFADDQDRPAFMNAPDTGNMLYEQSLITPAPIEATIIPGEKRVDVGVAMYEENLASQKELAAAGSRGFAAGGTGAVKAVDENTSIWESFFGPGSDLP